MNWTIKTKISTQKDKYTKKYAFWVNNFNKTKLIEIMNDYKPINERKYVKTFFKNKTIHPFSMPHDTIPTDNLSVDDFNK
jgi:hypothetical protein